MHYIGIDVHKKRCVTTIKGKTKKVLKRISFDNDIAGINGFIETIRKEGYLPATAACESTGNYWIVPHDTLEAAGINTQINMVLEMVRKRLGISCRVRTLKRVLRRLGFSYSKPRPIPDRSASEAEQEEFKQETAGLLEEMGKQGHAVMVCDEAAVQIRQGAGYGWRPANGHDTIRQGFSKKSVRLFGSLGTDGYHIRTTDAINSETFIEFLQELLKTCPKFVMVPDNASCHKSKMVTEFVESTDGDIRLVFLPPYTPQLNPIEMQWSVLKRLLSGRYFRSVGELKKAIMALVDSGEMKPVRLVSYLTP